MVKMVKIWDKMVNHWTQPWTNSTPLSNTPPSPPTTAPTNPILVVVYMTLLMTMRQTVLPTHTIPILMTKRTTTTTPTPSPTSPTPIPKPPSIPTPMAHTQPIFYNSVGTSGLRAWITLPFSTTSSSTWHNFSTRKQPPPIHSHQHHHQPHCLNPDRKFQHARHQSPV